MTVAAEIAHLCGDTPTAQESVLSPASLIQYVRDNGGFVHPDLQLLVGDEAEHGVVSLAGVSRREMSLSVPLNLGETLKKRGPWLDFLESLGCVLTPRFVRQRRVISDVLPILSAANHSNKKNRGRLVVTETHANLYGVDFSYSKHKPSLLRVWGIVE